MFTMVEGGLKLCDELLVNIYLSDVKRKRYIQHIFGKHYFWCIEPYIAKLQIPPESGEALYLGVIWVVVVLVVVVLVVDVWLS